MVKTHTCLDIREVLSEGGSISQSLTNFEVRPEQIEMACAVHQAFVRGRHLAVEAGTGVGKSFAYLVPIIEAVSRDEGVALISTFTITLQEQLINKDIPFLASCIPQAFNAVLAKGRGNYLCKRRLTFALQKQRWLFDELTSELEAIRDWASQTKEGPALISCKPAKILGRRPGKLVRGEHGNCRGRKCPHFRDCFYWCARRHLETANIIVANHAALIVLVNWLNG